MADGVEEYREYIDRRANRYMAQILSSFEEVVAPHLPPEAAGAVQDFKGTVRGKLSDFAGDANEAWRLVEAGMVRNQLGVEIRDVIGANA